MCSGGADSRAILSLVPDAFECIPTTVLEGGKGHREYELARRSASWLGRELEWVARPNGHYRAAIPERIDTIGPGWDFRHAHIHGSVAEQFEDADVVFGGYLADTLFKTHYMSNVEEGGPLQGEQLLDPKPDVLGGVNMQSDVTALEREHVAAVRARRREHHERLREIRPRTAGNWHRLWPLSNLAAAQYLTCLRMDCRVVEPFLWSKTYRLAARLPDTCRVNRKAFRHAFAGEMGGAGYVMTASGRVPRLRGPGVIGMVAEVVARYARSWPAIKRKLITGDRVPQGPWPPDHGGWHPVRPSEHFSEEGEDVLLDRLSTILADGPVERFFKDDSLDDDMRVRALALAFDAP